jgi:hypothetical protein
MNYAKKKLPLMLENEWFRGLVIAFLMIGAALILYGIYQFVDATVQIQNNIAYQREVNGSDAQTITDAEAQMFLMADIQYRTLSIQRTNSLVYGGIGLSLMALGWLGYDISRSQRRKRQISSQASI